MTCRRELLLALGVLAVVALVATWHPHRAGYADQGQLDAYYQQRDQQLCGPEWSLPTCPDGLRTQP